VSKREHRE
jgi:hypothetical protein